MQTLLDQGSGGSMFTGLDLFALVGYLAIICGIGVFFSRRNRNFQDYMFGGGHMPWPAIGISLIATSVSATTFLGNPADTYGRDMTYLMCNIGTFISVILIGYVFIPRFRHLNVQSAYELLETRFSRSVRVSGCLFLLLPPAPTYRYLALRARHRVGRGLSNQHLYGHLCDGDFGHRLYGLRRSPGCGLGPMSCNSLC